MNRRESEENLLRAVERMCESHSKGLSPATADTKLLDDWRRELPVQGATGRARALKCNYGPAEN
jgi:hypothetical protein